MRFRRKLKRHMKIFLWILTLLLTIIINKNTETVKAAPEPFMEDENNNYNRKQGCFTISGIKIYTISTEST